MNSASKQTYIFLRKIRRRITICELGPDGQYIIPENATFEPDDPPNDQTQAVEQRGNGCTNRHSKEGRREMKRRD